jgi:hypothetical protein
MKTVKLVSKIYVKGEYAGSTCIFPTINEATFNQDGTLDVPEDKVEELIKWTKDSFDFIVQGQESQEEKELMEYSAVIDDATDINLLSRYAFRGGMEPERAASAPGQVLKDFLKKKLKEEGPAFIEKIMAEEEPTPPTEPAPKEPVVAKEKKKQEAKKK